MQENERWPDVQPEKPVVPSRVKRRNRWLSAGIAAVAVAAASLLGLDKEAAAVLQALLLGL